MAVVVDLNIIYIKHVNRYLRLSSTLLLPYGWPLDVYPVLSVVDPICATLSRSSRLSPLIAFLFLQRRHKNKESLFSPQAPCTHTPSSPLLLTGPPVKGSQPIFQFFKAVKLLLLPTFLFFPSSFSELVHGRVLCYTKGYCYITAFSSLFLDNENQQQSSKSKY